MKNTTKGLPLSQLHKTNYSHIKHAYDRVMRCLYHHPETRNSDKALAWKFWETFEMISMTDELETIIDFECFENNTSEATIKRIRAYIQNTKRIFVPGIKEVARKRRMLDKSWARIMKKDLSGRKRI